MNNKNHIIRPANIIILYIVLLSTLTNYANGQRTNFVNYINDNKISMRFDGTIVKDKPFILDIPNGLKNKRSSIGESFLQILNYDRSEKIIIFYIPGNKLMPSIQSLNLSYNDFINFCEKEHIDGYLDDIKVKKHRRFGICKPTNDRFYAIYFNIKPDQVDLFNHSITSVHY